MKRVLHILKDANHPEASIVITKQAERSSNDLSILLIQEAVRLQPTLPGKIYVLEEDAKKRGISSGFEKIDYVKMLKLILSSDAVVTW